MYRGGGSDPAREGVVSTCGNGHPGVWGIATGDYFWFIANPVAPQRLDHDVTCFCFYLVVSADDQATFLAR